MTGFGFLVLGLALVFGWLAAGFEIGRRLADAFGQALGVPVQAGIGTFVLTLGVSAIGIVGPLGVLSVVLVCSLGLGAVIMTRFGTREYSGPGGVAVVEDPEPELEAKPKAQAACPQEEN